MSASESHAERVAAAVRPEYRVVALLHDAVEDGSLAGVTLAAPVGLRRGAIDALNLLTRRPAVRYADYIAAIGRAAERETFAGLCAREVKIADLRDNLYGRPEGPPPGDLARRYRKALVALGGDLPLSG